MTPLVDRHGRAFAETRTAQEGELAVAISQALNSSQEMWFENDIVRKKGIAYLRGMEARNDVISSAMRTRRRRLLLRNWDILPASDDPADLQARDMVKLALERMEGTFKDDLREICDAISYGFSLLEIVWEPWDSEWGRLWGFKSLKALLQENFRIVGDAHANVLEFVQTTPVRQTIPREKVVYAKYHGRPGDPYGGPVYADIYWADFFLRNVQNFWSMAAERFGSPLLKVTHPRAASPATRTDVQSLLSELGNATAIAISEDLQVDVVEASQNGRMTYEEFTRRMEQRIRIAVVGQSLTSEAPKTGTQALGTIQEHELDAIIEDDREWLETVVNDEIVRPWCLVNVPNLGALPRFAIKPGKVDPDTLMRRSKSAKEIGLSVSRAWLQEESGIPPAKDEDDELAGPPEPVAFPFREVGRRGREGMTVSCPYGEDLRTFVEDDGAWVAFAEDPEGAWWRAFSEFETPRVMRSIERVSRGLFDGVRTEARDVWKAIRDDLVKQVEKSGAIESGDMPDLRPKMKPWSDLVKRVWLTAHLDGRLSAVDELGEASVVFDEQGMTVSCPYGHDGAVNFAEELRTDVPSLDEAKAWFVGRVPMTDAQYARIAREAGRNAFYITTRENQEAVAQVLDALKQALDNDWGLPEFRRDVERRFKVWTGDVFGSSAPKTIAQADARLATVFRTNIMSALNRGRDAMFERAEDPAQASDPIVAYQYSAVMDAATRRTHAAMDGKTFAANDPIWLRWKPPAGYSCRCVRIPILASQAGRMAADALDTAAPTIGGEPVEPDAGFGRQTFRDEPGSAAIRFAEDVETIYAPWLAAA